MRVLTTTPPEFGPAAMRVFAGLVDGFEAPLVALPTGRTPVVLYREMLRRRYAFPRGVRLIALDEYCYPEPHAGTNAAFFRCYLPADRFPAITVPQFDSADPALEIKAICEVVHMSYGIDIAVVGIGDNGHAAFNEPGSQPDSSCRVVSLTPSTQAQVIDNWNPPPTLGMTLGLDEILAARHVVLLANGAQKASILSAALSGPITAEVPASFLQRHPRLIVVCDTDASALLDGSLL